MSIKRMALTAVTLLAATAGMPAQAEEAYKGFQAGDIMVRGRGLMVLPTVSSSVSAIGGDVDASMSFEPEVDVSYFFTPNISVEAIAAITRHSIKDKGSSIGDVDLGKVTLLPPTVTLQYHFMPDQAFSPYLGAGVNYTVFFNSTLPAGSAATSIHYDNGFGAAIQAGVDYHIKGNWFLNFDIKHIFLTTTAKINGGAIKADVSLDPTIVGFGIGYKF